MTHVTLVGVDHSAESKRVLAVALNDAALRDQAELHVAYVLDGYDPMSQFQTAYNAGQLNLDEEHAKLEELVSVVRGEAALGLDGVELVFHVLVGPAAERLAKLAQRIHADLIVVGSHGRTGFRRLVLGSVAEELVRNATCPVLVVREKAWQSSP